MRSTPLYLLLLCLLSSCNFGDWATPEPDSPYPEKTSEGKDFLVCMINNNLNLEVYREKREMLFGGEEIKAEHYPFSGTKVWISARRDWEEIQLDLREENPRPNTAYNITAQYSGWRGIFVADESRSLLRFSRIDSIVAAGEFVFIGIDKYNDSITFRGYFDIPFRDH